MRVVIFFIFLSTVFLYGGEHTSVKRADSSCIQYSLSQNAAISQQKFIDNSSLHNQVIEASDLDLVEESDDTDHTQDKFFLLKNTPTTKWYLTLSRFLILKEDFKGVKNVQTYFGYSQPIYIIQRVLRI
jgi:hypothetical protein